MVEVREHHRAVGRIDLGVFSALRREADSYTVRARLHGLILSSEFDRTASVRAVAVIRGTHQRSRDLAEAFYPVAVLVGVIQHRVFDRRAVVNLCNAVIEYARGIVVIIAVFVHRYPDRHTHDVGEHEVCAVVFAVEYLDETVVGFRLLE